MRIDKLSTLSQFVDFINDQILTLKCNSEDYSCAWGVDRITNYNDFLKQPLTKGMFVNEIEHPNNIKVKRTAEFYNLKIKEWQHEEDKIIFKGFNIDYGHVTRKCIYINGKDYKVYFNKFGECFASKINSSMMSRVETLHDLAELTNGELVTKNIKI